MVPKQWLLILFCCLPPSLTAGQTETLEARELWRITPSESDEIIGSITDLVCDQSGNLYVADTQIPVVRVYDSDGQYLYDALLGVAIDDLADLLSTYDRAA